MYVVIVKCGNPVLIFYGKHIENDLLVKIKIVTLVKNILLKWQYSNIVLSTQILPSLLISCFVAR